MAHAFFFPSQAMPLGRDYKQYYQERRLQHPIQSLPQQNHQLGLDCATFVYQSIVFVYGTHNSLLISDKHILYQLQLGLVKNDVYLS